MGKGSRFSDTYKREAVAEKLVSPCQMVFYQ